MMASDSRTSGVAVAAKVGLVVVVLAVCTVVCSQAAATPAIIGRGGYVNVNRVLFNGTVKQSGSYFGKATKDFCFPKVVNQPRVNITAYHVKDLNGTAGNVYVKSVAKNNTQLCMHFESNQRNKGFLFLFTVWGYQR